MTELKDPPRLLDAAEPGLRDVLRAAEQDLGSDAQVARLAERLGTVLAAPAATTAAGSGASAATGVGAAGKIGAGVLALMVAGGGAWLLSSAPSAEPPAPQPALPAAPLAPPAAEAPEPPPIEAVPSAAPPPSAAEPPRAPPVTPEPPPPISEAELLEQARSALKSDPARALSRANQHASRYPAGALVQEREVIAIKALRALDRDAEAERRAESFAKAYPGSAFARKLKPTP